MWTSSVISYISLFCHHQNHTIIFIFFSFTLYVPCFPFILIDHNQKQVLLIKRVIFFFEAQKHFWLFSSPWKWSYSQFECFTLINIMKLGLENNSINSTLSNVVNINAKIDNVDLTLFNSVKFILDIHDVCFNVNLTLSDVATSYQPNNNVDTTLKDFLGTGECC